MSIKTTLKLTALSALTALAYTSHAQAEGKLTVYCSVQNVVCEKVTQAFSKKYNVDAQFVRNSTGVVLGKIKAEKEKLISEGKIKREDIIDIADIITGKHPGRESDDEIIVYSVGGMPVEDIAWGGTIYRNALEQGIGIELPLWDKPDMA